MTTADIDLTLYYRKKHTPPPSVLLLTLPNENSSKDRSRHVSPSVELRSRQQKTRQTTAPIVGIRANNSDTHDSPLSSYGWQRHSDRTSQVSLAPDVAYRNTYLEESKREKSSTVNSDYRSHISTSRSPSPRSQHSFQQQLPRLKTASSSSHHTSDSSQRKYHHQYRSVYDYIRESIKQIERQRNVKQPNFSTRIKRPQNDDVTLRRVLGDKKNSPTSKVSSGPKHVTRNPQNFLNYMNHSREQVRVLHTTTPIHPYQQPQQINLKYNRQRTNLSQNQNDPPEKRQSMIIATATVGNS